MIRIHNTKLSIESLASNICNTEINVNLKTIINMKDENFPLSNLYISNVVTLISVFGILLFLTQLAVENSASVFAQKTIKTIAFIFVGKQGVSSC